MTPSPDPHPRLAAARARPPADPDRAVIRVAICEDGIFRLSDEAVLLCVARGMTLAPALPLGEHQFRPGFDFFTWGDDTGQKYGAHGDSSNAFRSNPVVLGVLEELGESALSMFYGQPSKWKIIEIPFGSTEGWRILDNECGPGERVEEDHRTWS